MLSVLGEFGEQETDIYVTNQYTTGSGGAWTHGGKAQQALSF